jgi:hypothetical protein
MVAKTTTMSLLVVSLLVDVTPRSVFPSASAPPRRSVARSGVTFSIVPL